MRSGKRKAAPKPPKLSKFECAHAEWLAASARPFSASVMESSDRAVSTALDEENSAVWRFIRTPAQTVTDLRARGQFVISLALQSAGRGEPTDDRDLAALAVLVSEMERIKL